MRKTLRTLVLIGLLGLPLAAAAHMSDGIQPDNNPKGDLGDGVECQVQHILYGDNYVTDNKMLFHIIPVSPPMNEITTQTGLTNRVFAVNEDIKFTLKTNASEYVDQVKAGYKAQFLASPQYKAIEGKGVDSASVVVDVSVKTVRWTLTEYEVDESLKVTNKGNSKVIGTGLEQPMEFTVPTDPLISIGLRATLVYEWSLKVKTQQGGKELTIGNKADEANDFISFLVCDQSPPNTIGFSPNALFGTSGDSIAGDGNKNFNFHRDRRGVQLIPKNPDHLIMFVADNAKYSFAGGTGVYHDRKNINALLYLETYISSSTPDKPARKPHRVEDAIGEYFTGNEAPPAWPGGMGRFVWVGPIDLRKDLAIEPQTTMDSVAGAGQNLETLNIHCWRIPIKALEEKAFSGLMGRYAADLKDQPRFTFLDNHFAATCFFEFADPAWGPYHMIENVQYFSIDEGSKDLGGFEVLRLTAAVSDAAGNWSVPAQSPELLAWNTNDDVGASGYKIRNTAAHAYQMPIIVFDNDKPNPMIVMTAQGRSGETKTTRFYIPNGDLANKEKADDGAAGEIGPFINDDQEWVFDYKGESATMKWLEQNDRKKFDEIKAGLEILENTRVVFEVVAYDNVNKIVEREDENGFCVDGVWTPQALPKDAPDMTMMRPVTWKIIDPTVPDESMLYDDPANKNCVYPDYVYRKVDPAKMDPAGGSGNGYGVEVMVNDHSNFNEPTKNGGSLTNWRRIKLWFNVIPSAGTGIDKMGNQETVDKAKQPKPTDPK